ncbi:hypothetical protein F4813DRAFT_368789 [Daldinia decipiens]|uniref:uncharacterized protein n=1 Tax=Daldinia decipiens TaxID=326647 RepID=UPI0020C45A51|nr:uncharacterized protein F4813DRAFT_368789 [Daldinia decipiens]KAI1654881.1 hypothetical protein F4813DRAFT_368789 [Daldinia decipiens]
MSFSIFPLRVARSNIKFIKLPTYRNLVNMATAHTIQITPENTGLWKIQQDEASAEKATELLQEDLDKHHVFFNDMGYHNHISHQVLALYGTGASPELLKKGYDVNKTYQRPAKKIRENVVEELGDWEKTKKYLGKGGYYNEFLAFFQNEIDKLGWEKTLSEYMFRGDERSEDMLFRMVAGLFHPIIQLMYGVEWKQPAIVAMALAQAAVHKDDLRKFLYTTEEAAKSNTEPMPSIESLLREVKANEKLSTSIHGTDEPTKISKGIFGKAWDEIVELASRVKVKPEELDERNAEMYHISVYEGASAAFYPGKEPKFDFFIMHHININPIYIILNGLDWIPIESKVRLLEWKIRLDLVQYAARGCPPFELDNIAAYVPRAGKLTSVDEQLALMHTREEDGHGIKLFRAVSIGQTLSEKYEDRPWIRIKGDMWTRIGHLVVDSFQTEPHWVRGAGEDEAWDVIPDRVDGANGVNGKNGISDKLDQVHL